MDRRVTAVVSSLKGPLPLLLIVVSVGIVLVVAQAIARLYLGVHYPTDVIGSMLAATAGTSAVIALRGGIDRWIDRIPSTAGLGTR
ncbi:membrane-associated phospholipid phosphatase [Streptosporangium album]|uniref:Membrane-associated phospholipid phosphatase n=1 Tax=Streptosporangium album TaxID=47479 RepID=A0A7W7RVT5_9ACTN|nr:phosphatase PAP2 family protein [Streptosporangium album]MBB4938857.1 membrane-associated phospholipid phosphatase [Streptosporangium album]